MGNMMIMDPLQSPQNKKELELYKKNATNSITLSINAAPNELVVKQTVDRLKEFKPYSVIMPTTGAEGKTWIFVTRAASLVDDVENANITYKEEKASTGAYSKWEETVSTLQGLYKFGKKGSVTLKCPKSEEPDTPVFFRANEYAEAIKKIAEIHGNPVTVKINEKENTFSVSR